MYSFPLLLTIYAGFTHAFEADHLLAVSNIVSQRNNIRLSLKDGIYWGLGHASTVFFIGLLILLFKTTISAQYFHYSEAGVGIMLIILAIFRLFKFFKTRKIASHSRPHAYRGDPHQHLHVHIVGSTKRRHAHSVAYGIGLVHGLAGSAALIVIVMSQTKSALDGLAYLIIFGCIGGMMLASGLFSIPFSKKLMNAKKLQAAAIIISSSVCLLYGSKVIYENLFA